jgi:hypothetical protein
MPAHRLESLTVTGGNHFASLRLDFAPGLNALIGGCGTGKSGVLHYVLYALGALPPLYAAHAPKFDQYIADNLGSGTVTLKVRTMHGAVFTNVRAGGEPAPRTYAEDGSPANVTLGGELFQVDAYAQGSLEAIGRTRAAYLALLQRRAEGEVRAIEGDVAEVTRLLAQNAADRARLAGEIADDEARVAERPQVQEALKALQLPGGDDPAAVAAAAEGKVRRGRERLGMGEMAKALGRARTGLDAYVTGALAELASSVSVDLERGPHAASAEVLRRSHEEVHRAAGAIEAAAGVLRAALAQAEKGIEANARALAEIHAKDEEAYRELVARHDADRERAAQRERLHRRDEELAAIAKRLDAHRREREERVAERDRLSERFAQLVLRLSAVNERVASELTAALREELRIGIDKAGDLAAYRGLLGEMTKGQNIRPAEILDAIASRMRPRALLAAVEAGDVAAIEAVDDFGGGKTARATKILGALAASPRLHELETTRLGDVARIDMRIGGEHQALDEVSLGQRCTGVLGLVLLHSTATLLVDQPEDHLDNAYVYARLIPTLRERSRERQILMVTHNPNLLVLSEPERIFAFEGTRRAARLAGAGGVDEMRELVERCVEGGREAFVKRAEVYGHLPRGGR